MCSRGGLTKVSRLRGARQTATSVFDLLVYKINQIFISFRNSIASGPYTMNYKSIQTNNDERDAKIL